MKTDLKITGIEFHQQVAGCNGLVVGDVNLGYMTCDPWADGNDVAVDEGIIGGFMGYGMQVIGNAYRQACRYQTDGGQGQQAAPGHLGPASIARLWRIVTSPCRRVVPV